MHSPLISARNYSAVSITRALLRLERTINLFEVRGGRGGEGGEGGGEGEWGEVGRGGEGREGKDNEFVVSLV